MTELTVAVTIIGILTGLAAVLMIGLPLIRPESDEIEESAQDEVELEEIEREKVFAALSDIEYDYRMNKLSEKDYHELKVRLAKKAVQFIKEEEEADAQGPDGDAPMEDAGGGDLEAEIEAEVAAEVGRNQTEISRPAAKAGGYCLHCGAKLVNNDQRFCQSCGGKLT